ncbi:MAG: RHS repeat-associated core domain-containing protein [Lonepinella koalarum]|nr:RHS repeat-associated core domain-containing protein [Lonepinella koalarum]
MHYNRFRYYDSDVGMFIQRDPIGLLGGVNVFSYAPNPVLFIDPFGLVHEKAKGYSVYGLYDVDPNTGKLSNKPYYIGITNDINRRTGEHLDSGRLSDNTRLVPIKENITYGQARGYEQALIEHYQTRTGKIGEKISQSNRGNKYNSFDINSKTRRRSRQRYFVRYYLEMFRDLKGGCV